jgi:hypothetical protein
VLPKILRNLLYHHLCRRVSWFVVVVSSGNGGRRGGYFVSENEEMKFKVKEGAQGAKRKHSRNRMK